MSECMWYPNFEPEHERDEEVRELTRLGAAVLVVLLALLSIAFGAGMMVDKPCECPPLQEGVP